LLILAESIHLCLRGAAAFHMKFAIYILFCSALALVCSFEAFRIDKVLQSFSNLTQAAKETFVGITETTSATVNLMMAENIKSTAFVSELLAKSFSKLNVAFEQDSIYAKKKSI
jgi:hypothetical protein